ncbi:ATP-binding protein, partial [Streptomyces sp. NPDC059744]|uniref:ATP-binding protein n=1 Tax=Streptomyces sp. NPDC059744 TaxID=3346929 RepID=UPI00365313BE
LLANATAYSHPDTDVQVTVQQSGGRGAFLVVDDAGIGMDDDALERARALLAGPSEVLLTELGDPPQTGFAVVGRLVVQYGLSCHIEPSPFGGMRTILRVPAHLLTVLEDDRSLSALAPKPVHAHTATTAAAEPETAAEPEPAAEERNGLPSRRRRAPRPAPVRSAPAATPAAPPPPRTPEQAEASWGARPQGTLSGRSAPAAPSEAQHHDDKDGQDDRNDQGDDET